MGAKSILAVTASVALGCLLLRFDSEDRPVLAIGWVNLAEAQTSLFGASNPVLVDRTNVTYPADGASVTQAVACGRCLRVTLTDREGTTNELLHSRDLAAWQTTHLRFVMHGAGEPVVYFIPHPERSGYYRSRRCE